MISGTRVYAKRLNIYLSCVQCMAVMSDGMGVRQEQLPSTARHLQSCEPKTSTNCRALSASTTPALDTLSNQDLGALHCALTQPCTVSHIHCHTYFTTDVRTCVYFRPTWLLRLTSLTLRCAAHATTPLTSMPFAKPRPQKPALPAALCQHQQPQHL
jgi:hypothetical protein